MTFNDYNFVMKIYLLLTKLNLNTCKNVGESQRHDADNTKDYMIPFI